MPNHQFNSLPQRCAADRRRSATFFVLCSALLAACSNDSDAPAREVDESSAENALVIVTERASPDAEVGLKYLHVVREWPKNGELDYSDALELSEADGYQVRNGAVFVYDSTAAAVTKYTIDEKLRARPADKISFAAHGVDGLVAETIWMDDERAFLVDEGSAQIIEWNPRRMRITESADLDESLLERDGFPLQFQQGVASGDRAFTAANWRNWESYEFHPGVALGIFDADSPDSVRLLTDDRCASSVALSPFVDEDGNVYVVGDGGLGFDVLASPNKTSLPQCVLRVREGETEFDPDFFLDLREATGSPGFYTAHPMADHKLLVNLWSPEVSLDEVSDPKDPSWYWSLPPYWEYAIVDLETGESKPVPDLERAAIQFSSTLRADGVNYVQLYRDDGGSNLYRVDTDTSVHEVLESPEGADVQFIGRL